MRIGFSCNIIPYFCRKLGKILQNLSSAAVVIGALKVKNVQHCIVFVQDYMLLVPANQYSPQDINLLPIDNSRSFIEDCVDEGYKIRLVDEPISQVY